MEALSDINVEHEARQLRDAWQVRVLAGASGHTQAIVLSILAHNFDGAILTLCQVVFPGFTSIKPPFLNSAGRVDKAGRIVADVLEKDGSISKNQVMYPSSIRYRDAMRRLADGLNLSDTERLEFFTCVKRWLVADLRLDPTMDPMDPDAKHLTRH